MKRGDDRDVSHGYIEKNQRKLGRAPEQTRITALRQKEQQDMSAYALMGESS